MQNDSFDYLSGEEFSKLSLEEQNAVAQILKELSKNTDNSDVYKDLYYQDYEEIPVDFETFLSNDRYLGKSTRNGHFLYPFWHNEAKKIFSRTDINEVALTGSIGTGKSTAACLFLAYHLYKTMCLKDPQGFFGLSPGTKIVYAFLNNTLDSSSAVGFDTVQSFVKESPWFLEHGYLKGRGEQEYVPNKGFMFLVGSRVQHTLGRAVIGCLTGDTLICTENGVFTIETLCNNGETQVLSIDDCGNKVLSNECSVIQTKFTDILYEIVLEDDTVIRCTPEHRFLMKDGTYKKACDISETDEFF